MSNSQRKGSKMRWLGVVGKVVNLLCAVGVLILAYLLLQEILMEILKPLENDYGP